MKYESIEGWFDHNDVNLYEEIVASANDSSIFVEIGCFKGRSTVAMCEIIEKHNKKIKFVAVDHFKGSWEHQDDPTIKNLFKIFLENTKEYHNYFYIIPQPSEHSAGFFEDKTIDFVYIDASHDYESVKQDLNIWFTKIKVSGTIAGHDYGWESVKQAVDEFALNKNLTIKNYGNSWKLV
jgi:hypothetical protein